MFMEINAFTGGTRESALFDISRDRKVDHKDLVKATSTRTARRRTCRRPGWNFLATSNRPHLGSWGGDNLENKIHEFNRRTIESFLKATQTGVTYWMEIRY